MAIKNNRIFICLLVLILLGVGCVSATPESATGDTLKISDSNETVMDDIDDAGLGQSISLDNDEGEDVLEEGLNEGTFTDLQSKIDAASDVLDLAYNFTFNSEIDNNELINGISINKDLIVNGHGYTISGSNSASIFDIANHAVILNNITFADGFHSTKGGAVSSNGNLTIGNSTFTNCRNNAGYAIYIAEGTLSLDGNDVKDYIIYNGGEITSPTAAVVLDNGSYYSYTGDMIALNATLTDDRGNGIYDSNLRFTVNGAPIEIAPSYSNGLYTCNFNVSDEHKYVVGVACGESGLSYQTAVIWNLKGTFTDLQFKINTAVDVLDLTYDFTFNKEIDDYGDLYLGITINKDIVVNGNGYSIRGNNSSIMNIIGNHEVILNNITFADGLRESSGGAVYFAEDSTGKIINCNFINNTAAGYGGAVYFSGNGTVTNCNFIGNKAAKGSAIYFRFSQATKTISNSVFLNNRADAEELDVNKNENNITIIFKGNDNLLNAIYSPQDVSFTNVTYWGADGIMNTDNSAMPPSLSDRQAGQNITIVGIVNGNIINITKVTDENGMIVLDVEGDYWIVVSHDEDSYYTEAETISTNMKFSVNVTSIATNSRTVNITAKSNILNEVMQVKLQFILPDGTRINATYGTDGTWWAVHTFDEYIVYQVNASCTGLENLTVNSGSINITKADSTITLDNIALNYGESGNVTVTAEGAAGITAKIGESEARVNGFVIFIPVLDVGTYTLTVTTIADDDHNPVTQNATVTVNRIQTELSANAVTATYNVNRDLVITLKDSKGNPVSGVSVTVDLNGAKTYRTDNNGQVRVSTNALAPNTYTAKVTFAGDACYLGSAKDVKVAVKKATPSLAAKNKKFKKSIKVKKYSVTLKTNTKKAMKNVKITLKIRGKKTITAKTNSKGKAIFKIKKLTKKGTYKATVTFKGNKYYNKVAKKVKITIK